MKFLLMFVASALWAMNVFAADALSESAGAQCDLYTGKGSRFYIDGRRVDYAVTLRKGVESGEDRLDYSFVIDGQVTSSTIVLAEEFRGNFNVFSPTSGDPWSYPHIGWGMHLEYDAMQREEGTPKKTTILLSYSGQDGNRHTHHILANRKAGWGQLISSGLVVAADGQQLFTWVHELSLVSETCQPQN